MWRRSWSSLVMGVQARQAALSRSRSTPVTMVIPFGQTCLLIVYAENRFPEVLLSSALFSLIHYLSLAPGLCAHCLWKLCNTSHLRNETNRTCTLGHGWARGVWSIAALKLSRKRRDPDRIRYRFPSQHAKRTRQGELQRLQATSSLISIVTVVPRGIPLLRKHSFTLSWH